MPTELEEPDHPRGLPLRVAQALHSERLLWRLLVQHDRAHLSRHAAARMHVRRVFFVLALAALPGASSGCKSCHLDSEEEEQEELNQARDHFWRVQIRIVGQGTVKTRITAFDCASDGVRTTGGCGPKLVTFKEIEPPLMEAVPAAGWKLDHWESLIRGADGSTAPRQGRMPDGRVYLNGFGYEDTGALETVTAVFVEERG